MSTIIDSVVLDVISGSGHDVDIPKIDGGSHKKNTQLHSWYKHKTWKSLRNNKDDWDAYLKDMKRARDMTMDWREVYDQMMPIVYKSKNEFIGVIRAYDSERLKIHSFQEVKSNSKHGTYSKEIPSEVVNKYINIPGYFLFHTHPKTDCDPFPSDIDIYSCLQDCLEDKFYGQVVICIYGIIIYYITREEINRIFKIGGMLAYQTFCYDVIMAWNSITSMENFKLSDKINLLDRFGIKMVVIPSPEYIHAELYKSYRSKILVDRFINTKYKLLDIIKERIKFYEKKEKHSRYSKQK